MRYIRYLNFLAKKTFLSHTVLDNRPLLLLLLHSMVCKSISLSHSSFSLPLYISFTIPSGIEMRIKVSSSKYTFSFVYQGYIKIKQFKKEPTSIYLTKMLTTFSLRSVCYTLFQQHLNLKMWNSRQIELHDLINICIYYIDLVDKWWDRKLNKPNHDLFIT